MRFYTKYTLLMISAFIILSLLNVVNADLTKEQGEDVALFSTNFIEKGNARRDSNGYPLLVYALSNNFNTSVAIRDSGYKSMLYNISKNNYHKQNGTYINLGNKWCMDCGGFISFVYNTTLGLDMYLSDANEPWHIKDMYNDAAKGDDSKYFYFVYKNISIGSIDYSTLKEGDLVITIGSRENHGLIYVGDGKASHASRNAIKYSQNPPILGFDTVVLNRFYKSSTKVSILRVNDGVIPQDKTINSKVIWPDTNTSEILIPLKVTDGTLLYNHYSNPDQITSKTEIRYALAKGIMKRHINYAASATK